jgi:Fe-S cluster assembly ATPase SufC
LITHQEEVAATADRASSLCGGTILRTGEPMGEILESYAASGGAAASLLDDGVARLVVSHKLVLRANSIPL